MTAPGAKTGGNPTNRLLAAIGAAVFLGSLIVSAPASLLGAMAVNSGGDIAYSSASGTVWKGAFFDTAINGVSLGIVRYRINPFSLLKFQLGARIDVKGGAINGEGDIAIGFADNFDVSNTKFLVDLAPLAPRGILGQPVSGVARINIEKLRLNRKGCRSASGDFWTDVLDRPAQQYDRENFPMAGGVKCDGKDILLVMSGESDGAHAALEIRVRPDLTYELTAIAQPDEEDIATALRFFGFEDEDGALRYGSAGALKGPGS